MLTAKSSLVIGLCMFLNIFLHAQNLQITYQKSDSLFVCGSDTLFIQVQNQLLTPVNGAVVQVTLPAGLQYATGTIQGATELNVGNLSAPTFTLPVLNAQQSHPLFLLVTAQCEAADLIDAGQLFQALISVTSVSGNAQVVTTSILVETGALVIESVTPAILSGEKGDTLYRTICFKNTRLGKIGNLHFQDAHQDGFEVFVEGADAFTVGNNLANAEFSGSFFTTVGNGDQWLDLEEKVCLTERVIITDCGIPPLLKSSLIRAAWGCDASSWCRYDSSLILVNIKTSTFVPELEFEQIWTPPTNYCGDVPAVMGFTITNIGKADAKDVLFNLTMPNEQGKAGIAPGSFKIISAGDTTAISPNISTTGILATCDKPALYSANLVIPLVPAKDSVKLVFDVLTCVQICGEVFPAFKANYLYQKACPPGGINSGTARIVPDTGYTIYSSHLTNVGVCLEDNQTYTYNYFTKGKYLLEDGFLHLQMTLPKSITLDTVCTNAQNQAAPYLLETSFDASGNQNIHMVWQTPFDVDTLSYLYCIKFNCDTSVICGSGTLNYSPPCCILNSLDISYWSTELNISPNCGITDCEAREINVDCGNGGGGGQPVIIPPGDGLQLTYKWTAYRNNSGWKDETDDRHADLPLEIVKENWRKDRFLPGDTLRVEFCASVDTAITIDTFGYGIIHSVRASDMGVNDNDIFGVKSAQYEFTDTAAIVSLGSRVRVKYADGQEATCFWDQVPFRLGNLYSQSVLPNTTPPQVIDETSSLAEVKYFPLVAMAASGCLPKPYLELGDSVFIFSDYKINTNFTPLSSNFPDPPLIGFRTKLLSLDDTWLSTDSSKAFQYSGWQYSNSSNQHTIKPCEQSVEPKKFRYSMRIARENMFPNEVRPLAWISDYTQTNPEGLELQSAQLEYLTLQDSTPWISNISLPFTQSPLNLEVDFSPAFSDPIDEGFTLKINLIFKPNCLFSLPDSSIQFIQTTFEGCLNGDTMIRYDTIRNAIGFFANTPRFSIITNDSVVNSPTRSFDIDFVLKNALVAPAPFAWIYMDAPSGLINQLELFQMPQNQPIPGNNGFFGLNQFGGITSKNFRITGENLSCDLDSLYIYFGWSCNPIQQISDASCGIDTMLIMLNLERPELELDIIEEPDQIFLCEESDWFEFEVYNAKFGYAYELLSTLKLPQGLQIAPGSCQISYPEGSPWVNIPNPLETGTNFYEWQVSDLLPAVAANGLPGFNMAPQNSYRIRFKVLAECGFVANTPIIYGATATEPCGRQANVLNKLGQPLQINGLQTPYGVLVNVLPIGNPANTCGDIQEIQVSLQLLGTPSATDSVYITLPQGVQLVNNSYLPGLNAPSGPVTPNSQGFQLPLPILQGGGAVNFQFKVQYSGMAGCADKTLQVQTRVRTEAFCPSLGAPCVVYLATGEGIFILDIKRPQLLITDADFTLNGGTVSGNVVLTNNGEAPSEQTTLNFWRDLNGNGQVDAADQLLNTWISNSPIGPNESVVLNGLVPGLDSTEWCNLLIQLPADPNCMCTEQVFHPEQWLVNHTDMQFCSLNPVQIGVPEQDGNTYTWFTNSGIACVNCATTTYTPPPGTPLNAPVELVLTEMSGDCKILHSFQLSFSSAATITASDAAICPGQSVTLSAEPSTGTSYFWSGPGIQNPNQVTQQIQPSINSTYTVVVTFTNGCTTSQTIDIQTIAPDTVILPGLITCQGVPVDILGNVTETPGTYQLLLTNSEGCDSLVFQSLALIPPVQTVENFTFCLGDTLKNVQDTFFTTSGQVCRTYKGLNGCDSVHCAIVTAVDPPDLPVQDTLYVDYGQIITLTGPSGFESYWWIPAPVPPCEDCMEVSYPADSAAYQEFRLQVTDANGCPGELVFRVLVLPPCSADSLHIPNAFTPNGDGANDVFRVVPYESSEVVSSLEIYNRWGQKIYENVGNSSWDGTIEGQPAVSDVYVYIVTVKCGELVGKRVGDVTLLR